MFKLHHSALYVKSLAAGAVSGLTVTAYRVVLGYAAKYTNTISALVRQNLFFILPLFAVLICSAIIIGFLVKKYPMIKGSGIPQVKGVLEGKFTFRWLPEIIAKFFGGALSLGCGLSLGREGPSIQLGAYSAYAVSAVTKNTESDKKFLLTAAAASGLAAAFNAPLAGIMFAYEELRHRLTHTSLVCIMFSCMAAEVISELFLGQATVFSFTPTGPMPVAWYPLLLPLGLLCGAVAAVFNGSLMVSLNVHEKIKKDILRPLPAFCAAGVFFIAFPQLLGSGHNLLEGAQAGNFGLAFLTVLICGKLLFTALCYGSGSPGGIFFPLLILGALIGKFYNDLLVQLFSLPGTFSTLFIILGMTAFFSGVTRAPITGCILISEMSGSLSHLIPLIIISLTAYGAAKYLGAQPVYEGLLERMLKKQNIAPIPLEPDDI